MIKSLTKQATITMFVSLGVLTLYAGDDVREIPDKDYLKAINLRTNLLYDAALTPNIGVEMPFRQHWSVSMDFNFAWWGKTQSNRVWRLWDISMEYRRWLKPFGNGHFTEGHHIGIYMSAANYDFQFGNRGWQVHDCGFSAGMAYGYAFTINSRLRLDCWVRAGYSGAKRIRYHVVCGEKESYFRGWNNYYGPTGAGITLCWHPWNN